MGSSCSPFKVGTTFRSEPDPGKESEESYDKERGSEDTCVVEERRIMLSTVNALTSQILMRLDLRGASQIHL